MASIPSFLAEGTTHRTLKNPCLSRWRGPTEQATRFEAQQLSGENSASLHRPKPNEAKRQIQYSCSESAPCFQLLKALVQLHGELRVVPGTYVLKVERQLLEDYSSFSVS